jgi:uncharacterized membrane-anchored protein YhcB (DUF1043 family)
MNRVNPQDLSAMADAIKAEREQYVSLLSIHQQRCDERVLYLQTTMEQQVEHLRSALTTLIEDEKTRAEQLAQHIKEISEDGGLILTPPQTKARRATGGLNSTKEKQEEK